MRLRWGWAVPRVLSHVLVLAVVPAIAAPAVGEEPAAPGFTGLERLYFERLEDPGRTPGLSGGDGQGVRSRVLRELLPAELDEGKGPRTETAVVEVPEGPVHGGLQVRDWKLGSGDLFLRQVVLADHPRIRETVWGLYSGGRRTDLWFFSPLPQRTESKLLPPIVVEEVLRADGKELVLRASGSMARPQGAAWFHGVDLVFAVEGDALRYRYGVRRYSFVYGYDRGAGRSVLVATEVPREADGATVVERRVVHELPAEVAEECGVAGHETPGGSFEELVEIATCITSSPAATVERRGEDEPSFIERGGSPSPPPSASRLVVASFGGAWQEAQRKAMFEPFAARHGVEIVEVVYDGDYDLVREKGAAGEWDVVDVEPAELLRGAAEGIYAEIDYSGIDRDALIESAVHPYGVGLMTYSIVLGYDTRRFPADGEAPRTWSDFWDVERFPGKRALRGSPQWMLEIALLADGVPAAELYPIDLDRALAGLDRIRDHVVVFDDWSQPAELLAAGDAALAVGTNGRLLSAKEAGEPVEISWDGGIVASDYFVIPKGSRHREAAQELVRYAVSLEAQAAIPTHIDYGPVNRRALDRVPEAVLPHLATYPPNLERAVTFRAEWWLENEAEATRRYEAWLRSTGES